MVIDLLHPAEPSGIPGVVVKDLQGSIRLLAGLTPHSLSLLSLPCPFSVVAEHPRLTLPLPPQQQKQHLQLPGPWEVPRPRLWERVCRRRAQHGGGERGPARFALHPDPGPRAPEQLQRLQRLQPVQPLIAHLPQPAAQRQAQQHRGLQRRGVAHRARLPHRAAPAWGENR